MMQSNRDAKISVVMPVYRCDKFVKPAIDSILNQSYRNFELIIVCDEPSQNMVDILETFRLHDPRVSVVFQERSGLIPSRNICCKMATGKYIAMMDCDDISHPDRLQIQYDFLKSHPGIGLVGSWYEIIDENDNLVEEFCPLTDPYVLRWMLFFGNFIGHSTVMMRRSALEVIGYYDLSLPGVAEDYSMYLRVLNESDVDVIPAMLVKYRQHTRGITGRKTSEMMDVATGLRQRYIEMQVSHPIDQRIVASMNEHNKIRSRNDVIEISNLVDELYISFTQARSIPCHQLEKIQKFARDFFLRLAKDCLTITPLGSLIVLKRALLTFSIRPALLRE
jgi:glycosyltransferase involved in cell wall biosynthesis